MPFQSDTLERARRLWQSGYNEEATRLLQEQADASAPELALLAQIQAASGAIPQATVTLERLLALEPRQHRLRTTRGAMLFELRRFDEASSELERVVREAPENETGLARYYLASVYKGTGHLGEALAEAERARSLLPARTVFDPDSGKPAPGVAARLLLAGIRFELGQSEARVEPLLREVIALAPEHAPARYLLSRVLLKTGRSEGAKEELERFSRMKRAGEHIATAVGLARLPGRGDDAIAALRLAVAADPESARALALLGRELARAGRLEEARLCFDRTVALRPEAAEWIRRMGR